MPPALRHRNLPQLLLQAREALMARFRPVLSAHGLTEQQWRILRALLEHGPREPHQLCALCQISSPSISGVLLRMEAAGLVARERVAEDQRRVRVSIAARGQKVAQRVAPAVERSYAQIEQQLGLAALQQVYDALDALIEPLGSAAPAARRPGKRS